MDNYTPDISIVVPVYNSAHTLRVFVARVQQVMAKVQLSYELILTDDCSTDSSWTIIKDICQENKNVVGIHLANNCGQWCASLAGMSKSRGAYIVTIDDDLEYDPADIIKMYQFITNSDYKVVFGRSNEKYTLQNKNKQLADWRNNMLNRFWRKGITDSFKIFQRNLVFGKSAFLPAVSFEAYITQRLERRFWGYTDVNFSRRFAGRSNYSLLKKMNLFLLLSSQFITNPGMYLARYASFFFILVFVMAVCLAEGWKSIFFISGLVILLIFTGALSLIYLHLSVIRNKPVQGFQITGLLNRD